MKAGADLEKAGHPTPDADPSFGWFRDPGQNLQQRGFTRAVPPDDADHISLLDFTRDIFESPEVLNRVIGRSNGGNVGMSSIPTSAPPYFLANFPHGRSALTRAYVSQS